MQAGTPVDLTCRSLDGKTLQLRCFSQSKLRAVYELVAKAYGIVPELKADAEFNFRLIANERTLWPGATPPMSFNMRIATVCVHVCVSTCLSLYRLPIIHCYIR